MSYDYDPLSEEQAQKERYNLLEDGVYCAVVIQSTETYSKKMNKMCKLTLDVYDDNHGSKKTIDDYLLFTPGMIWKMKHFCDSAKLEKEYAEKKFSDSLNIGRSVLVKVKIKKGDEIPLDKLGDRPPGSKYPDKNEIEDYVMTMKGATRDESAPLTTQKFDDDIPF